MEKMESHGMVRRGEMVCLKEFSQPNIYLFF